jgi:hypothetical protein
MDYLTEIYETPEEENTPSRTAPFQLEDQFKGLGYNYEYAIHLAGRSGGDMFFYGRGIAGVVGLKHWPGSNESVKANALRMKLTTENPRTQQQEDAVRELLQALSGFKKVDR